MQIDFSFNNPEIRKYFNGDDSCAPIRELVYLHNHPLVQPNFVEEINQIVIAATETLAIKKVSKESKIVKELERLCVELGKTIPNVQIENPEETLLHLRSIYNLCQKVK